MALSRPIHHRRSFSNAHLCLAAILIFGVLLRMPMLGDPAYKIDEQFYQLVGRRMLGGVIPYVDIWDRKPIGLFLIYAFAALIGEGPLPYQFLATAAATGSAFCIFAIDRRTAGDFGATIAAILYLLWLEVAEGGGGQAPVFYNRPVAAAAMLLLRPEDDHARARGFGAMLLIGIAIQIKYTVIFEGAFFGLVAAARAFRRDRGRAPGEIALLTLTMLAPTLLVIAAYAAIGQLDAFWFANFTSIFLRGPTAPVELHYRVEWAIARLDVLALCILAGIWAFRRDPETRSWQGFMLSWCATAVIGYFSLGVFYSHYLLPVFLPFCTAAAPAFRRGPIGLALAALCGWLPIAAIHWPDFATTARSQRQMASLSALVPADVSRGCMQMFDGPPILYQLTHACTVSRFVFPDHLSAAIEAHATGVDPVAEVRRILAIRPEVITIGDVDTRPPNRASFTVMRAGLARYYRLVGKSWVDERYIQVFVRR